MRIDFPRSLAPLAFLALTGPAAAFVQCPVDDAFEPNDHCGNAALLLPGQHAGLVTGHEILGSNDDYFRFEVGAGELFDVSLAAGSELSTLTVTLYSDAQCGRYVGQIGPGQTITRANTTGSPVEIHARTYVALDQCGTYELGIALSPDPCQSPTLDDALEDADDCATATVVDPGGQAFQGLTIASSDPDFYVITLNPDGVLDVYADDFGAQPWLVEMWLYDQDSVVQGECGVQDVDAPLDVGTSHVSVSNDGVASRDYYLMVIADTPGPWHSRCGDYELEFEVSGSRLGTPACYGSSLPCPCDNDPSGLDVVEGCANSTGVGATLVATGTNLVARDDLVLVMTQGRPHQPSVVIQGATQVSIPFRDGVLCAGSPTERLEVVPLDAAGAGSTTVSIVTEGNVQPGATRVYQQWYRDPSVSPCGQGSNFSNALALSWF